MTHINSVLYFFFLYIRISRRGFLICRAIAKAAQSSLFRILRIATCVDQFLLKKFECVYCCNASSSIAYIEILFIHRYVTRKKDIKKSYSQLNYSPSQYNNVIVLTQHAKARDTCVR